VQDLRQGKHFFFEKKKQKTFIHLSKPTAIAPAQTDKVFLLLFVHKKKSSLP